jgi:hypothetical protein
MPWTVVGPLLCVKHNMQYAWQSMVGDMLNGFSHNDNNFNIIDVRDVAEAQLRIAESADVSNGDRYNLVCHAVRKRSLLAPFSCMKNHHLPRQAQDKRKETLT